MAATKGSRFEASDWCLLLLMFRHGLRISEACALILAQVDTESRVLHVARLKKGLSTTRPLRADEIKVIMTWLTKCARINAETDAFLSVSAARSLTVRRPGLRFAIMGSCSGCRFPPIRICSAMLVASPWPTRARIRG